MDRFVKLTTTDGQDLYVDGQAVGVVRTVDGNTVVETGSHTYEVTEHPDVVLDLIGARVLRD